LSNYPFLSVATLSKLIHSSNDRLRTIHLNRITNITEIHNSLPKLPNLRTIKASNTYNSTELLVNLISHSSRLQVFSCKGSKHTSADRILQSLNERAHHSLVQLDLSKTDLENSSTLLEFLRGSSLKSLILQNCQWVNDELLIAIADQLVNSLVEVQLDQCGQISDRGVIYLVNKCTSLRAIRISYCTSITNLTIEAMCENSKAISELDLSGCSKINDRAIIALAKCFASSLRHLGIRDCEMISADGIEALARSCSLLDHFDLRAKQRLSNQTLDVISSSCKDLRTLAIDGNSINLQPSVLRTLIKRCPSVRSFTVIANQTLTSSGVRILAKGWKNLESLTLSYCSEINDDALYGLAKYCSSLQTLNFSGCSNITKSGLKALLGNCLHLKEIHLNYLQSVVDGVVWKLAECSELRTVNLYGCDKLSSSVLEEFIKSSPRLEKFSCSIAISSSCLKALARCCGLSSLRIGNGKRLTDDALKEFSSGAIFLEDFELGSSYVDDATLQVLLMNFPRLDYLALSDCKNLTEKMLPIITQSSCTKVCFSQVAVSEEAMMSCANDNPRISFIW